MCMYLLKFVYCMDVHTLLTLLLLRSTRNAISNFLEVQNSNFQKLQLLVKKLELQLHSLYLCRASSYLN